MGQISFARCSGLFVALALAALALMSAARTATAEGGMTITSLTPDRSPAGMEALVVIEGTGFPQSGDCMGGLITITFDGISAFPLELPTETQVRVVAPAHDPGPVEVVVTNVCDGTSDTATYTYLGADILSGEIPDHGFGLFVFGGGTNQDLIDAADCTSDLLTFWATDESGEFVTYIPAAIVGAANAPWYALFPDGIPANTALIGRCR